MMPPAILLMLAVSYLLVVYLLLSSQAVSGIGSEVLEISLYIHG